MVGAVAKSKATLRIIGDELDPDEVTHLLGRSPTRAERKGQVIQGASGRTRTARTGGWRLEAKNRQPEDLDGQVTELLSGLTKDLDVWRLLSSKYQIDLFCGLFLASMNEGLTLSPATLVALGERGILIGLDIYGARPVAETE